MWAMMTKLRMWSCCNVVRLGMEPNTVLCLIAALLIGLLMACQMSSLAPTATPAPSMSLAASQPSVPAQGAGRVEVLNAADAALDRGDPSTASGLYERVLNTPTTGEAAATTSAISAYATFRDVVALLADAREEDARAQVDALQQTDASAPFARLANQLWDQYGMVGSLRGACAQVQPQIAAQAGATLATLQTAGVSVDPATLCPAPVVSS
jgi:hypothetical protein